jgi:hypothetical protein
VADAELAQRLAADLARRDQLQVELDQRRAADRARLAALQGELESCERKRLVVIEGQQKDELALVKKREDERRFSIALDQTRRIIAQLITPTLGGASVFAAMLFLALPGAARAYAYGGVGAGLLLGLGVAWLARRPS